MNVQWSAEKFLRPEVFLCNFLLLTLLLNYPLLYQCSRHNSTQICDLTQDSTAFIYICEYDVKTN